MKASCRILGSSLMIPRSYSACSDWYIFERVLRKKVLLTTRARQPSMLFFCVELCKDWPFAPWQSPRTLFHLAKHHGKVDCCWLLALGAPKVTTIHLKSRTTDAKKFLLSTFLEIVDEDCCFERSKSTSKSTIIGLLFGLCLWSC